MAIYSIVLPYVLHSVTACRDIERLRKSYGVGRWRKLKGTAMIRLSNNKIRQVEVHWYEAHGIGKKRLKIKRFLD